MTMAAETENNPPASETKDIKDVREMKDALKDDAPQDNKQDEKAKNESKTEKMQEQEGAGEKKTEDAAAAAGGDATGDASNANAAAGAAATPAPKAPKVWKTDFEKDVVYLYQFPRTPQLPCVSPYCLKVEIWLRLNAIKYEVGTLSLSLVVASLKNRVSCSKGGEVVDY